MIRSKKEYVYTVVVLTNAATSIFHTLPVNKQWIFANEEVFDLALPRFRTVWAFMFLAQYTAVAFQLGELPSVQRVPRVFYVHIIVLNHITVMQPPQIIHGRLS